MTGREWDAASVLAAADEWVWVPRNSRHLRTNEFLAVAPPAYMGLPVLVRSLGSERPASPIVDDVVALAEAWGQRRLSWRVSDTTMPADLERELMRRGATVDTTLDVLALPLTDRLPDFAVPPGIPVRAVTDEATLRDALLVSSDAFPGEQLTDQRVASELEELRTAPADGPTGRVVSYLEGRPAATGGWTLAGPVARLWGGATHTALRGRGAYRAVLSERVRLASSAGATLALSLGRSETSSPILRALGFTRFGGQREVLLDASGG